MDKRDQSMVCANLGGQFGQCAQSQSIDHRQLTRWQRRKLPPRCGSGGPAGERKPFAEIDYFGPPAQNAKTRHHAPVIYITACRGFQVPRRREDDISHDNGPSYQARAR